MKTFKVRMETWLWIKTIFKILVSLGMAAVFINSLISAIMKYCSEPIATSMFKTIGDNEKGIKFPQLTICDIKYVYNDNILRKCRNGSQYYQESLSNCLTDPEFSPTKFNKANTNRFKKFINKTVVCLDSNHGSHDCHFLNFDVWTDIYHPQMGHCLNLNLELLPNFEFLPVKDSMPDVEIGFQDVMKYKTIALVYIHSKIGKIL